MSRTQEKKRTKLRFYLRAMRDTMTMYSNGDRNIYDNNFNLY